MYANKTLLRIAAVTLAALVLVFWGQPTGKTILLLAGLLLVALAIIEFLSQPPQHTAVAPQPRPEPGSASSPPKRVTPRTEGELVMVQESPSDSTRPPAEGRRLGGGAIASLSGVGLLLIFMIQNTERVRLDFLFWKFTWPLWLLTMASALLGAIVWFGLGVMRRHRRRKERRQARRD